MTRAMLSEADAWRKEMCDVAKVNGISVDEVEVCEWCSHPAPPLHPGCPVREADPTQPRYYVGRFSPTKKHKTFGGKRFSWSRTSKPGVIRVTLKVEYKFPWWPSIERAVVSTPDDSLHAYVDTGPAHAWTRQFNAYFYPKALVFGVRPEMAIPDSISFTAILRMKDRTFTPWSAG